MVPHRPRLFVDVPGGVDVPLVKDTDPDDKKFQKHLLARVKVFNLSDPADLAEYQRVWQMVSYGQAVMCEKTPAVQHPVTGNWSAFLRWGEYQIKLPQ